MTLYDYRDKIITAVLAISPANYLIAGITQTGELITDEAIDSGTRFKPEDVIEQISIRGGMKAEAVKDWLVELAMLAEEGKNRA